MTESPDRQASRGPVSSRRGVLVGRPGGVEVRVHLSFAALGLLGALAVHPLLRAQLPDLGTTAVGVVAGGVGFLLLVSVAVHELAHAAVGRALGIGVLRIDLWGLGGATALEGDPPTARGQALVSVAGPLVNVLIGGFCAVAWELSPTGTILHEMAIRLAVSNGLLAAYNLLPGLPLDGGQVLRAAVWGITGDRLTGLRAAGYGGLVTAGLTALLALSESRRGGDYGLFTLIVAVFIGVQAQQALRAAGHARRLPGVVAGRLARPAYLAVGDLPLAEALRRAAADGRNSVVLGAADHPSAVLSEGMLARVPAQRRPWVPLSSVARAVMPATYLDAALSGEALLEALREDPATEYVVMDGARLVGVLHTADVAKQLA